LPCCALRTAFASHGGRPQRAAIAAASYVARRGAVAPRGRSVSVSSAYGQGATAHCTSAVAVGHRVRCELDTDWPRGGKVLSRAGVARQRQNVTLSERIQTLCISQLVFRKCRRPPADFIILDFLNLVFTCSGSLHSGPVHRRTARGGPPAPPAAPWLRLVSRHVYDESRRTKPFSAFTAYQLVLQASQLSDSVHSGIRPIRVQAHCTVRHERDPRLVRLWALLRPHAR